MNAAAPPFQVADVVRFVELVHEACGVVEVRMPKYNAYGQTAAGYFDDPQALGRAVESWDGRANIFITLNPADPALLARANNRIVGRALDTTADADIIQRRWLLLDIDPVRPAGISSTADELASARDLRDAVVAHLAQAGWPEPLQAMSGNGCIALYRVDLPNTLKSTDLVTRAIQALSTHFDTEQAVIDTTVTNAARLVALVGTRKVKGDPTADRPHRRSSLEHVPDAIRCVTQDQLAEAAGATAPDSPPAPPDRSRTSERPRLAAILAAHRIAYREQQPDARGVVWYHVEQCPFHDDGRPYECGVGQRLPDGPFVGHCFHPEGADMGWAEWKAALGLQLGDTVTAADGAGAEQGAGRASNQASQLLALPDAAGADLFHTRDGDAYARIQIDDHLETLDLGSRRADLWLRRLSYTAMAGRAPSAQAVTDALNTLRARAQFDGTEAPVYVRVGRHDARVYIDLGMADWSAIEIDADDWRVIPTPPVHFRRARGTLALPMPTAGGQLSELRPFLNVATEIDFRLAVSTLIAMLLPEGPYPPLVLAGEQGSAKSTFADVVRRLVDPRTAARRSPPRSERDLMIAAQNGWLQAYDNVSGLPGWLSDAICRLSTGGGLSTRELYTDRDEVIFDAMRPVVLNGIEDVAARPDLVDRSIALMLPTIDDAARRDERAFWAAFDAVRPRILGALLDAVVLVIRDADVIDLPEMPRMADFARRAAAAAPALDWTAEEFLAAYTANRLGSDQSALEGSPLAAAIEALIADGGAWDGTASALLKALAAQVPEAVARQRTWPQTARALSGQLRRIAPSLRRAGIDVTTSRSGRQRRIHLDTSPEAAVETPDRRRREVASPPSLASPTGLLTPVTAATDGDANDDAGDLVASLQAAAANLGGEGRDANDANDANALREAFDL